MSFYDFFFSERERRCLHACPMEGDVMRKGETLNPRWGRCLPKTLEETVSIGVPSWKSSGWSRDSVMTFLSSYSPGNLKMQIRETWGKWTGNFVQEQNSWGWTWYYVALKEVLQQGTTARDVWVHLKHSEGLVMGQGGLCRDGCGFLHFIFIVYKSLKTIWVSTVQTCYTWWHGPMKYVDWEFVASLGCIVRPYIKIQYVINQANKQWDKV